MHAKQLEMSGNQIQAAEIYKKSIEFAPSGDEAKNVLLHAINILETAAQQKAMQGKDKLFEKLTEKAEELRMLLPDQEIQIQEIEIEKPPKEAVEKKAEEEEIEGEHISRIYVYEYDYPVEKTVKIIEEKITNK